MEGQQNQSQGQSERREGRTRTSLIAASGRSRGLALHEVRKVLSRGTVVCLRRFTVYDVRFPWPHGSDVQGGTLRVPCACCGESGHIRQRCKHKDADCHQCANTGHQTSIGKSAKQAVAPQAAAATVDAPIVSKGPSICIFCVTCKVHNTDNRKCPTCKNAVDKDSVPVEAVVQSAPAPKCDAPLKQIGAGNTEVWLTPTTDGPIDTNTTEELRTSLGKKQTAIDALKDVSEVTFKDQNAQLEGEITKLSKQIPSQHPSIARAAIYTSNAELESKVETARAEFAAIETRTNKEQIQADVDEAQWCKETIEKHQSHMASARLAYGAANTKRFKTVTEAKEKLDAVLLDLEAKRQNQITAITNLDSKHPFKPPPLIGATNTVNGIQIAPGAIVHSNHVKQEELVQYGMTQAGLTGITIPRELAVFIVQSTQAFLQTKAHIAQPTQVAGTPQAGPGDAAVVPYLTHEQMETCHRGQVEAISASNKLYRDEVARASGTNSDLHVELEEDQRRRDNW